MADQNETHVRRPSMDDFVTHLKNMTEEQKYYGLVSACANAIGFNADVLAQAPFHTQEKVDEAKRHLSIGAKRWKTIGRPSPSKTSLRNSCVSKHSK